MTHRIENRKALQNVQKQLIGVSAYVGQTSLGKHLVELVSMRVSQINGCAFCLAMHARDLRQDGEREDRLTVLDAWRETTWFTDRERAALAWAEEVTLLPDRQVSDAVFEQASHQFDDQELADLTLGVIAINGWNRLNIAFHNPPQPFTIEQREAVPAR